MQRQIPPIILHPRLLLGIGIARPRNGGLPSLGQFMERNVFGCFCRRRRRRWCGGAGFVTDRGDDVLFGSGVRRFAYAAGGGGEGCGGGGGGGTVVLIVGGGIHCCVYFGVGGGVVFA